MISGRQCKRLYDSKVVRASTLCLVLLLLVMLIVLSACERSDNRHKFNQLSELPMALGSVKREANLNPEPVRVLKPLELTVAEAARAALGEILFNDTRLSGDGTLSCASCHDIPAGGDDGRRVSVGVRGQIGTVNAPTVLNSGHSFRQYWDGRADTLSQQALEPVTNPMEMDAEWSQVIERLSSDRELVAMFNEVFQQKEITQQQVTMAIAGFEMTLVTPSPFDKYLEGDASAISQDAARGYTLFKDYGCVSCHQGVNLGGNLIQYFGAFQGLDVKRNSPSDTGTIKAVPMYKVPTLRNVALTAPYFHSGRVAELSHAVRVMGSAQLGRVLTTEDIWLLVAFLESLTGEVADYTLTGVRESAVERTSP